MSISYTYAYVSSSRETVVIVDGCLRCYDTGVSDEAPQEYTLPEAARIRGVARSTLEAAAKRDGEDGLKCRRVGKFYLVTLEAVDDYLAKKRRGPIPGSESAKRSGRWHKKEDA